MRWSPLLAAAVLAPLACGFDEDGSSASQGYTTGTGGPETTEPTTAPALPPGFWPGVTCPPADGEKEGSPRFYFDLDAGKSDDRDFFRLPFPLDARRKGGGIDLTGFPRPPEDLDPTFGQVVKRWISYLEADADGFAVNGAVLFRSTHGVAGAGGIVYVNVTAGHPDYGKKLQGLSYTAQNGDGSGNNYICRNWFAVETIDGYPLDPGATYAVLLTDAMRPVGGGRFEPDADFSAMLQSSAPKDPAHAAAWQTFAPLRDFLASPENGGPDGLGLTAGQLVGGTVFTTGSSRSLLAGAREAARAAPLHVHDLHLCEAAGEGPCASAPGLTPEEREARRCGPPNPQYREVHGRVRLPLFQEGIAPYEAIGGRIDVEDGAPVQRSSVDACFSLMLPAGAAPDAGWPALVYAHGTGGSFRSAILEGIAPRLAALGVATISLEGVLHGERRGDSDEDGEVGGLDLDQLAFNVFNPESARDTMIQGAIDQFSAFRLAEQWTDTTLLEGQTIAFDASALFFMGHSQGAGSGALFLPYEPLARAFVLSGGGANLVRALLGKQEPKVQNPVTGQWLAPRELLQLAFQERPDRPLDSTHPMLVLLDTYANRSDADHTARLLRSLDRLLYIGHVDSYTPLRAAGNLAMAAGTQIGGDTLFPAPCDGYEGDEAAACHWTAGDWFTVTELPATGNVGGKTAVTRMLPAPAGKDGHYAAFQPAEIERIVAFITSALENGTPTVQ